MCRSHPKCKTTLPEIFGKFTEIQKISTLNCMYHVSFSNSLWLLNSCYDNDIIDICHHKVGIWFNIFHSYTYTKEPKNFSPGGWMHLPSTRNLQEFFTHYRLSWLWLVFIISIHFPGLIFLPLKILPIFI
jgi:hypothetical protein